MASRDIRVKRVAIQWFLLVRSRRRPIDGRHIERTWNERYTIRVNMTLLRPSNEKHVVIKIGAPKLRIK